MPIQTDPTATTTVTWGMQSAGRYNVSNSEIASMIASGFSEVKTELWEANPHDLLLATETMLVVSTGNSIATLPSDFDHEIEARVYWSHDSLHGYAQSGYQNSVQLAAASAGSDDQYVGLYIFFLAGSGSQAFRQITQYNGTTNWATLTHNLTASPTTTTEYLIGQQNYCLERADIRTAQRPFSPYVLPYRYLPKLYEILGRSMRVWAAPNQSYPIVLKYVLNLTRLDETSTTFVRHLRERFNYWVQGIKVKTMARHDDERYEAEYARWEAMKARQGAINKRTERVIFSR